MSNVPNYDLVSGKPFYSPVSGKPSRCNALCPTDCSACCGEFRVTFKDKDNNTVVYDMPRNANDCVWNWEATVVNLACDSIGAPFFDPSRNRWKLDLYTDGAGGQGLVDHYLFVAAINANCPPTNIEAWTNLVDGTHFAGELVSIVCLD